MRVWSSASSDVATQCNAFAKARRMCFAYALWRCPERVLLRIACCSTSFAPGGRYMGSLCGGMLLWPSPTGWMSLGLRLRYPVPSVGVHGAAAVCGWMSRGLPPALPCALGVLGLVVLVAASVVAGRRVAPRQRSPVPSVCWPSIWSPFAAVAGCCWAHARIPLCPQ